MTTRAVEVPESLLNALADDLGASGVARWATEAMVEAGVREGRFTVGYAAEVLGLGYFEALAFLNARRVPVEVSDGEMQTDRDDLRRMFPDLASR